MRRNWSVEDLTQALSGDLKALEDYRQEVLAKRRKGWGVLGITFLICALAGLVAARFDALSMIMPLDGLAELPALLKHAASQP